jgi:hypothetical protein
VILSVGILLKNELISNWVLYECFDELRNFNVSEPADSIIPKIIIRLLFDIHGNMVPLVFLSGGRHSLSPYLNTGYMSFTYEWNCSSDLFLLYNALSTARKHHCTVNFLSIFLITLLPLLLILSIIYSKYMVTCNVEM